MAQIDLKKATIYIKDGGADVQKSGAINNVAGYTTGATTLLVDAFVGAVETGGTIVIGTEEHTIASHIETTLNTTSITIAAPGLTAGCADNAVVLAKGKVNQLEVKIGTGTLSFSEKRNIEYTLDRGTLDEVRSGDEVPMDVKMDFVWEYLKGSDTIPSVEDALKKRGAASTWRSSDSDQCRPFSVDVVIRYVPDCGGGDHELITLNDFRYESLDHDARGGTVSCSGKCNVTEATVVRSATA